VIPDGHILVGNTFPLALVSRRVVIEPTSVPDLQAAAVDIQVHSFWGHMSTLTAAQEAMGLSFMPAVDRPALTLDEEGYPSLDGISFGDCWVVTPNYIESFRPKIGQDVPLSLICGWRVLRLRWERA